MTDVPDQVSDSSPSLPPANHCANCGSPLSGHYCGVCGQRNREIRRPVYSLLRELFHVLLDLDGRAYRTMGLLLTRPAFLSNVYVSGQRARYTPPLRLFIAVSILLFVVVTVGNSMISLRDAITDIEGENTVADAAASERAPSPTERLADADMQGIYNLIEWIHLPLLSDASNANLHVVMRRQADENLQQLIEDPSGTLMGLLEYITVFMLALMPVLALIQYLFFFNKRRYYIEHLVLVLHNSAFVISVLLIQTLMDAVVGAEIVFLSALAGLAGDLLIIWMLIYLFLSLKYYFQRGWVLTSLFFLLISTAYAITTAASAALLGITLFLLF